MLATYVSDAVVMNRAIVMSSVMTSCICDVISDAVVMMSSEGSVTQFKY